MRFYRMSWLPGFCFLFVAGLITGASPALAQGPLAEALPTAQSLIERHLEATGGKAALAKVNNRVSTGTLLIKPMGIKGTVFTCQARSGKYYTRLELDRAGMIERGSDGKVFWEKTDRNGLRTMADEELALMRVLIQMDLSDYASLFEKLQTTGTTMVGDEECFEAALTPAGGKNPVIYDFSKSSGLIVRLVTMLPTKDGEVTVETLIGDYAKVDDVLVARQSVEKALTVETNVSLSMIEQNVKLDAGLFTVPASDVESPDVADPKISNEQ